MTHFITYFEIIAFLASLAAWRAIRQRKYMQLFLPLLFIIVATEIYETFFRPRSQISNALLYNIQVPAQQLLYLLILYLSTQTRLYRKMILVAMGAFALGVAITGIFLTPHNHFNVLGYCLGSLLIIIAIIVKFYEMLKAPTEFNFLRDPFFYMLFAYLLFNVGTLPYFSMINWLYSFRNYKRIVLMYADVMSILNYILYSTYTIAFVWMIRKKGFS